LAGATTATAGVAQMFIFPPIFAPMEAKLELKLELFRQRSGSAAAQTLKRS